jgi:hypothetical protein
MHTFIILALILNIPKPFIKSPYSRLFHINKIYISEYIIHKNSINNITFHFIIFSYENNSHSNMNIKFTVEVGVSLYDYKHESKL